MFTGHPVSSAPFESAPSQTCSPDMTQLSAGAPQTTQHLLSQQPGTTRGSSQLRVRSLQPHGLDAEYWTEGGKDWNPQKEFTHPVATPTTFWSSWFCLCWSFSLNCESYHIFVLNSLSAGDDTPLPYSCLENSKDRGAWRATVHRVTKSQTQLNTARTHIVFQFKSDSDPTACEQNPWCMLFLLGFTWLAIFLKCQTLRLNQAVCVDWLKKKREGINNNNLLSTI